MNPEFFAAIAWKSTLVLGSAGLAVLGLRKSPAAVRHLLWILALVSLLLLPALYRWAPVWNVPAAAPVLLLAGERAIVPESASVPAPAAAPLPWLSIAWFAGALLAGSRLGLSLLRARSLPLSGAGPRATALCRDVAVRIGLRRIPSLAVCSSVEVPWTAGFLRPRILLPAGAAEWPEERLRVVLLHELVHIQRLDWLSQMAAECVSALYWFHPLVWFAAGQARRAAEQACDDAVLRLGTRGADYAEHLLAVARAIRGNMSQPAVVAMALRSHLEDRLRAMLDRSRDRRGVRRTEAALAAAACLLVLAPLAVIRAQTRTTGTLSGTVYDVSGAAVPGARVIASGIETRNREVTTSDPAGQFIFESIPSGRYSLQVLAPGFKMSPQIIAVEPNQRIAAKAVLDLGAVEETMNIVARGTPARVSPRTAGAPQRIRVGGSVQATRILKMVRPAYPDRAKQLGVEGTVLLQAVIGTEGTLLNLAPLNTLTDPDLVKAAMDGVSQWRYQPTLLNGVPVEVVTTITLNFKLEE